MWVSLQCPFSPQQQEGADVVGSRHAGPGVASVPAQRMLHEHHKAETEVYQQLDCIQQNRLLLQLTLVLLTMMYD